MLVRTLIAGFLVVGLSCSTTLPTTKLVTQMAMIHEQLEFVELVKIPGGTDYETPVIASTNEFVEALVSWNVTVPDSAGLVVELSVRRSADASWSPWLHVGDWGQIDRSVERLTECEDGRIDIDFFSGETNFSAVRLRFAAEGIGELALHRYDLCLSSSSVPTSGGIKVIEAGAMLLDVPKRSQQINDRELAARICSPTSVAMLMEFRGINESTVNVAQRLFDQTYDIYGNWTRAIQGAFSFGVPGYLRRFSSLESAESVVASGQPLVVSIRVPESGLTGAPYVATTGHLIVIVGFDESGNVIVNDPAAASTQGVRITYDRAEIEEAWLGKGGVAYVLLQPQR